jgi:beta-hydroxylase
MLVIFIIWKNPKLILFPINYILKLSRTYRSKYYGNISEIFPVSIELEDIWELIRDEGINSYNTKNKKTNYLDNYNIDLGEEDKTNWSTIPLRVFGHDKDTSDFYFLSTILRSHPEIKSCIYSIMEPGKVIKPHIGPYDGLIRYQLPLYIPDGECYLEVDGEKHYWKNGKSLMFDETLTHGAVNNSEDFRMVLLIDIERPGYNILQKIINKIVIRLIGYI